MSDSVLTVSEDGKYLTIKNGDKSYVFDFEKLYELYGVSNDVYDYDLVKIRQGDIVYGRSDAKKWAVYKIVPGVYSVEAYDENGNFRQLKPEWLTHKKFDTQKSIDDDMDKDPCAYFGFHKSIDCVGCPACNYTTCYKAMIKDLIRRQKELSA